MGFIRITDTTGKEHEFQFIDDDYISLSYGHAKFNTLRDIQHIFRQECEAEYEREELDSESSIDDYFEDHTLIDVIKDHDFTIKEMYECIILMIQAQKKRKMFDSELFVDFMRKLDYVSTQDTIKE
jgi:hypothetical protein